MALPVEIDIDLTSRSGYHGPFKSSEQAFYVVALHFTFQGWTQCHKATDPTASFAEQDGSNRPDTNNDTVSMSTYQQGDNLHVVMVDIPEEVFYARFDMTDDTWQDVDGAGNTEVSVFAPTTVAFESCDICVLSTGKIRIVYQGDGDMDMGSTFERIDESNSTDGGNNWNGPNKVDNSDATDAQGLDFTGPRIVLPPNNSDQCHVFMSGFNESNTTALAQVAISSGDTVRTVRDTGRDVTSDTNPITHGIGFVRSGVSKVRIGYRDITSNDLEVLEFDAFSDDTDRTEGFDVVSTADVKVDLTTIVACLASDGSIVRGLMVKVTGDADDAYEFFDDGADSYTLQSSPHIVGTVRLVSCNVYDRDGDTKLAILYDDNDTTFYDEISIAAIDRATLASVDMATQNLFHGPFEI